MQEVDKPFPRAYFGFFNGEQARRSAIEFESPPMVMAVDSLVNVGPAKGLIGQTTFLNTRGEIFMDVIYAMPSKGGTLFNGTK